MLVKAEYNEIFGFNWQITQSSWRSIAYLLRSQTTQVPSWAALTSTLYGLHSCRQVTLSEWANRRSWLSNSCRCSSCKHTQISINYHCMHLVSSYDQQLTASIEWLTHITRLSYMPQSLSLWSWLALYINIVLPSFYFIRLTFSYFITQYKAVVFPDTMHNYYCC